MISADPDLPCRRCGGPVDRNVRGGPRRIYCSAECSPWTRPAPETKRLLARCETAELLRATHRALALAELHGWSAATLKGVVRGLRLVLAEHGADTPVRLSTVRVRLQPHRHCSAARVAQVLADVQLLSDDTCSPIRTWIDTSTSALPLGFSVGVRAWLLAMLDGTDRMRPRTHTTLYVHFGSLRPLIEQWTTTRHHLREITRTDIDASLRPLRGHPRYNAISALRSLFRYANRKGLVFGDPTRHLRGGRSVNRVVVPMTTAEIAEVHRSVHHPAQRLAISLAAVHGARPAAVRALTLDDLDVPNRRIRLAGHEQRLGELALPTLLVWLEYRRRTWPHTINRHVLLSRVTALGIGPASPGYLERLLGDHVDLEQIRQDRILQEALATDADPLRLTLVFGLDHTTAMAYATAARHLLASPVECAQPAPTALPSPTNPSDSAASPPESR